MTLAIVAIYIAITVILTMIGIERQIAGFHVFIVGILLTPLAALYYIYAIKRHTSKIKYYHCNECNYIYPVKMDDCPICMEEGKKIKLKKYKSPYNAAIHVSELKIA